MATTVTDVGRIPVLAGYKPLSSRCAAPLHHLKQAVAARDQRQVAPDIDTSGEGAGVGIREFDWRGRIGNVEESKATVNSGNDERVPNHLQITVRAIEARVGEFHRRVRFRYNGRPSDSIRSLSIQVWTSSISSGATATIAGTSPLRSQTSMRGAAP
jgi:hypothetical protein